ncbi:molybdopterin-dependent oxidoreductase [Mobilicoccus massiliensis]|uniref:molybdopterin-dependent oxidoreductase n=1 Tax=Mobilicoccus massiliensis TaxID=1522310 RepID=UPI00058F2428|nr:molybdopterin-dependent oxidoreductase [Mobilicoccus massiliensis]
MTSHVAHWGVFTPHVTDDGRDVGSVTPWREDAAPSPLLGNVPGSVTRRSRVARPTVRRAWWEDGPGPDPRRGRTSGPKDWVTPPWDEVLDRLAAELRRVHAVHGAQAIYGGSYGWSSAGRFHHAQSQLHRFLNVVGGYTRSVNSYSTGASEVILPRVLADEAVLTQTASTWDVVAEHTELLIAFGGVPVKNTGIDSGGSGDHPTPSALDRLRARGARLVSVSPLRDDLPCVGDGYGVTAPHGLIGDSARAATESADRPRGDVTWWPISPGTDVALMLAMIHVLLTEDLADREFLTTHCVGADEVAAYVLGRADGVRRDPAWAERLTGIPAADIADLAREAAARRTLVTVTWSLQRARHGEQPIWAGLALAAHLGQIGLQGGGFESGYGSMNKPGCSPTAFRYPSLPQGRNPVREFAPVARVSDLLLHPGAEFSYDGGRFTYPDIRMVWWAGGNPFHHHQDLGRLREAFTRPDTVVVSDPYWTATARHADVVLPSTTSLERDDLGGARSGARLTPMRAVTPRYAEARDDYEIYAAIAARLGLEERFTEGRDVSGWIEHLYEGFRDDLAHRRILPPDVEAPELPPFAEFWAGEGLDLPRSGPIVSFSRFRADPERRRLATPSGRIELASATIASFDLPDCPGRPTWLEPEEWLGGERAAAFPILLVANQPASRLHSQLDDGATSASCECSREAETSRPSVNRSSSPSRAAAFPILLVANQPASRLHSQLDDGATSAASKVAGREPIRLNPADAAARGIGVGDVVLVCNDRGACLAGAVLSADVRPGVAQLSTGAWFDPYDPRRHGPEAGEAGLPPGTCVHGNPNVLTADVGTSALAQACTGQHVLVEIARWDGPVPDVLAHVPPTER